MNEPIKDLFEVNVPWTKSVTVAPNESYYWQKVAESRLKTVHQERDAKKDLQARLDALEAEHAKLTADYYEQASELQAFKDAKRRQERAERYAQAYYERRTEAGL